MNLTHANVAVLTANDGVERVELTHPRERLEREGAWVTHLTPDGGQVRTFDQTDPSETLAVVSGRNCTAVGQFADALVHELSSAA